MAESNRPVLGAVSAGVNLDDFIMFVLHGVSAGWKPDRWREELATRFNITTSPDGEWIKVSDHES